MSATRLYMGRLPPNVTKEDVQDHFKGFQLADVRLMGHFAFLNFESEIDTEDALRDFAGRDFMGASIILEKPRESRRRDTYDGRGPGNDRGPPRGGPGSGMAKGVRVNVIGIPHATSWQDLKDYGRIGNSNVMFADVDRNNPGNGIIEFGSLAEAEDAIARLSGVDINNTPVKLEIASDDGGAFHRGPPPRDIRPRFDDRGPSRGYDDRHRYDDRRDDRGPRRDYDRGGDRDRDRDRERELRRGRDRERSPPRRRGEDDRYIARARYDR